VARRARLQPLIEQLSQEEIEALFASCYTAIWRMALALSGRERIAQRVVRLTLDRGLRQLRTWTDITQAEAWFYHHTLLATRQLAPRPPSIEDDLLLARDGERAPEYAAFVRAIRALPIQQAEAFLLHYGQNLNTRYLGIAMDCSTAAAANHLNAARAALRALSDESFEARVARLRAVVQSLGPDEELALPRVRSHLRRFLWPRRIARVIGWLIGLAILAGIGALAWWLSRVAKF
jgi:DNA-directed RNA polymerase specialized sigma24 family protein